MKVEEEVEVVVGLKRIEGDEGDIELAEGCACLCFFVGYLGSVVLGSRYPSRL